MSVFDLVVAVVVVNSLMCLSVVISVLAGVARTTVHLRMNVFMFQYLYLFLVSAIPLEALPDLNQCEGADTRALGQL